MSEPKFTKTPWDYVGDHIVGVLGECECKVAKVEGAELAYYPDRGHEAHDVVVPISENELPEGVTMEEHIANCKLIAAAPELLAACERALAVADLELDSEAEILEVLRSAIAKAKGESE